MTTDNQNSPLAGVRVIDLTNVIMGPFATHILADMGADVIKVEKQDGDSFRFYKPARNSGMSGGFLHLNRNKRSIVLDLKSEVDRKVLDELIATADVFIHSFRPATVSELGYDYERISKLNPRIIYCGAYGFGTGGPYAHKSAYDDLIQAASGLAALNVRLGGEPRYLPTVVCDKLAGQAAAYGILAALFQRSRTGNGEKIEVPMFETAVEFALIEHMQGFIFDPPLGPPGFRRVLNTKRKPFRTKDGYACILPYSDKNWRDFYEFTGRMEYSKDLRFADLASRAENIEVLYSVVEEEAVKRTTAEWVDFCDGVGIPAIGVLDFEDLAKDKHLRAVGFFAHATHPSEGEYVEIRSPVRFGGSPFEVRRHAPRLGEHTAEIRAELEKFRKDEP
jgi:crotonobetainyl-CoA:carnitine CoA-transferase CaiB-like acyl-CoA transferase